MVDRSPEQVQERVDEVVFNIRSRYQTQEQIEVSKKSKNSVSDVLCVAHGHTLIAFAMRWVGMPLNGGPRMLLRCRNSKVSHEASAVFLASVY